MLRHGENEELLELSKPTHVVARVDSRCCVSGLSENSFFTSHSLPDVLSCSSGL